MYDVITNDKNLIKRIQKNSKDFNLEDSIEIIRNRDFVYAQIIALLFCSTMLSILFVNFKVSAILGYIIFFLGCFFCFIIYKKYKTIEIKVKESQKKEKINEIMSEIKKRWYKLFSIMNDAKIEKDRLDYTREKFALEMKAAKNVEDYKKILEQINEDIKKYNLYSGKYSIKKQSPTNDIEKAYKTLLLPVGAQLNDVKNQYRKLQKVYHPDNQDVDREKILEINAAYSALKQYLK